jgi:YD repeat-containing protein
VAAPTCCKPTTANRTVEQIDDAVVLSAYDNLNRLTSQAPGGPMVITGALNEPGTVSISGVPVTVDANSNFRGTVPTTTGTNTFTIVAKDVTGNTTTRQYEVDVTGSTKTFVYDSNGNLTTDAVRTFEWDARNQPVAVSVATQRTEFSYDGLRRRVRRMESASGVPVSDVSTVYCERDRCEDRTTVPKPADRIKHLVVLMLENRSFDHMFGFADPDNDEIDDLGGAGQFPRDGWVERNRSQLPHLASARLSRRTERRGLVIEPVYRGWTFRSAFGFDG